MFELYKQFRFDAAHSLPARPNGDERYTRLHGHSFLAEVWICGERAEEGWVLDLGELERRLSDIKSKLDHQCLNEVAGLEVPTMENIAAFVWNELADVEMLTKVVIRRESCGEGCIYRGPKRARAAVVAAASKAA